MYEKNEIEISCKTQLGINIFVSRLLEKPEIIELSGHFFTKSYNISFIDSLECGLKSIDLLMNIKMSIYKDVFLTPLPLDNSDWLQRLNLALQKRFRMSKIIYSISLPRKLYIKNLKVFKQLIIDLPDLRILIICDEYLDSDSIFIMDEFRLQALFDKFFAIFTDA